MQVTTLNRVISLFIIGVVVMIVVALLQWSAIEGWVKEHYLPANWVPLIGVVATLALGAVAIVVGVAVDAVADSFVRNLMIERLIRRESFPWASRPLRGMLFWRHRMRQVLGDDIPKEESSRSGRHSFSGRPTQSIASGLSSTTRCISSSATRRLSGSERRCG